MSHPSFSANPRYRRSEELLIQLHSLFRQGLDDSSDADAIRDEMEELATWLSRDEMDRLGGLSGDLYSLDRDEIFQVVKSLDLAEQLASQLDDAVRRQDWASVLELLRHRPKNADEALVARVRATAYWALGQPKSALEFARFELRCNSNDSIAKYLVLCLTSEAIGDLATLEYIDQFEADTPEDLLWLSLSVAIIMRLNTEDTYISYYTRLQQSIERILVSDKLQAIPRELVIQAVLALGVSYLDTDDVARARVWYKRALELAPTKAAKRDIDQAYGGLFGEQTPEEESRESRVDRNELSNSDLDHKPFDTLTPDRYDPHPWDVSISPTIIRQIFDLEPRTSVDGLLV